MAGQVLLVASGKGGVGKSTVTVGVAAGLTALNQRCVLLDLDFGMRSLDILLGVEAAALTIADVLEDRCAPNKAVVLEEKSGLRLCPAGAAPISPASGDWKRLCSFVELLARHYDFVFLDCPAGISPAFETACACSTGGLIVTVPEPTAVRSAAAAAQLMCQYSCNQHPAPTAKLVINKAHAKAGENILSDFDRIMDEVGLPLAGVLPMENTLPAMSAKGDMAMGNTPFHKACARIAARLLGEQVPLEFH